MSSCHQGCPTAARIPSESSRDAADEELELMLVGGIAVMNGIVVGKDDKVLDGFFLFEKNDGIKNKAVYTAAPVAGGWAGAVKS